MASSDENPQPVEIESLINGAWTGHYYYANGNTDGESIFTLLSERKSNTELFVAGYGKDDSGIFTIRGTVVEATGEITFRKKYASWGWNYEGRVDRVGESMSGRWDGGSFIFGRKREPASFTLDGVQGGSGSRVEPNHPYFLMTPE